MTVLNTNVLMFYQTRQCLTKQANRSKLKKKQTEGPLYKGMQISLIGEKLVLGLSSLYLIRLSS